MNTHNTSRIGHWALLGLFSLTCAPVLAQSADEMRKSLGLDQPSQVVSKAGTLRPPPPRASLPHATSRLCPGQIPESAQSGQTSAKSLPDQKAAVISLQAEAVPYVEVPVGTLNMDKLRFEYASSAVDPRDLPLLRTLAAVLREPNAPRATFAIAGHTDASGDDAWNDKLSCDRALQVRQVLIDAGVGPERLTAYGWGSRRLVSGLAANHPGHRRVEVRRAN